MHRAAEDTRSKDPSFIWCGHATLTETQVVDATKPELVVPHVHQMRL